MGDEIQILSGSVFEAIISAESERSLARNEDCPTYKYET